MDYAQNAFYNSKSSLDADTLNLSLESEESFGHHLGHSEDGNFSRDLASGENHTPHLSCLNSVETDLQNTHHDLPSHDGGNSVYSPSGQSKDTDTDKQIFSKNALPLLDQNSYEAALDPGLLNMTSLDCYSDVSSCSEKDLGWITDICMEKSSDQASEYQIIASAKDLLIGQLENNSSSFSAEKDGGLEERDKVSNEESADFSAAVEMEDNCQSDCLNTAIEGQVKRSHLELESKCSNFIDGEYKNLCPMKTVEHIQNQEFPIQNSGFCVDASTNCKQAGTECSLDLLSTQQKVGVVNEFVSGAVEVGDLLEELNKMPNFKDNSPKCLSNHEFENTAHSNEPQDDNTEKAFSTSDQEHSSFSFLQSCFGLNSLDNTNEPESDFSLCKDINEIHQNCDANQAELPVLVGATFGPAVKGKIQHEADEGILEPLMLSTYSKAQVSSETGQQNSSVVDQINANSAGTEDGNTKATSNVLLLSSTKLMKKLQPVVLLRSTEWDIKDGNKYHCSVCQQTTQNVDDVIEHHYYKHSQHEFKYCHSYGCYFSTETLAVQHLCRPKELPEVTKMPTKRLKPNYMCQYCHKLFVKKTAHYDHERRHVVVTQYRCKCCGLYFPEKTLLHSHKRKTNCTPLIKEPYSQSKWSYETDLKKPNKSPFKLEADSGQAGLDCFVKLVDINDPSPRKSKCAVCGKNFKFRDELQAHLKTHSDLKPFKCDECKKCFKYSWNLDSHRRWPCSGNIKPSQKSSSNKHMSTYSCPICSHVYLYPQNVTRHLLQGCLKEYTGKHKGKVGSRYKCPLCSETFSMSCNRSRHIKKTCFQFYKTQVLNQRKVVLEPIKEEKWNKRQSVTPSQNLQCYRCKVCPAWFVQLSLLSQHMKKHLQFQRTTVSLDKHDLEGTDSNYDADQEWSVSNPFACHFCDKRFSSSYSLKLHKRLHKGSKPFRCLVCGKNFKARRYLVSHKKVHRRKIQCSVCKKILPTIGELLKHRQLHTKKGILQCPDCPMQFQFPVFFLRHVATHEKRKIKSTNATFDHQFADHQVNETTHVFENKLKSTTTSYDHQFADQQMKEHLFCAICQKTFDDSKAMSEHCSIHLPHPSVSTCPFCPSGRRFTSRIAMIRHIRLHTGEKPFPCQMCGIRFHRKEALKFHQMKCDGSTEAIPLPTSKTQIHDKYKVHDVKTKIKKFNCSYCPHVFSTHGNLKLHERAHEANSLVPCSNCWRYYKKNKIYKHKKECRYKTLHSEDTFSSGEMQTCESEFQGTYPVDRNVQIRARKVSKRGRSRPLKQCPHCSKYFLFQSYLLRHLRTHLSDKDFTCKRCGQTYVDQNCFLQHVAICNKAKSFSREKTTMSIQKYTSSECGEVFKCNFCTKTFATPRYLRQHILTHNDAKPYNCEACESSFSRHDHLKRHQTTCKGKKARLEVCLEKIPLDHVDCGKQTEMQPISPEWECSICCKTFCNKGNLTRHITMQHSTFTPFSCRKCGSTFYTQMSLKRHNRWVNCKASYGDGLNSNQLATEKSNALASPSREVTQLLTKEERPHADKWKLRCEYCSRRFRFQSQLKSHINLHTGEKPFKCTNCDERFARSDYMKRHLVKCIGKEKEKCLEMLCKNCGGLFTQETLDTHQVNCVGNLKSTKYPKRLSNTGSPSKGREFSCVHCNANFFFLSQLQRHVLTKHRSDGLQLLKPIKDEPVNEGYLEALLPNEPNNTSGDLKKPFHCQQCNLRFLTKSGLATHMRTHTLICPLSCKKCNKGFWSRFRQQKHMRKCRGLVVQEKECASSDLESKFNNKVLVFGNGSNTTGTGVLQTKFSCKDEDKEEGTKGDVVINKYQCSECEQTFTDGLRLISHLEAHGREDQECQKRHQCNFCDATFNQGWLLQKHVKTHQASADNTCPKCSKSFRYPSDLITHQVCHDPNRPFVCDTCELRFWNAKALGSHQRIAHPLSEAIKTESSQRNYGGSPKVFSCIPCNKVYTNKTSYLRHCRVKHRRYSGSPNDYNALGEQQLDKNVSNRNEEVDEDTSGNDSDSAPYFPCHVCGKTFQTSESLEDHQRCHLGEKPYECEECGKCFFQLVNLQQHQRSHKSEFQCQMCGKGFVSLFALRKHKHTHGRKRPHQCPKCSVSFTKAFQLAEHMITHRDENFPCDVCHKNFSCKASRAEHRKIHTETEELPPLIPPIKQTLSALTQIPSSSNHYKYYCEFCHLRFPDSDQLSEHGCDPTKERQYSCSECNKHFLHGSHLKKHQLTHQLSGTRSFQCNSCHMSFSHRSHFLTHLETHALKETSETPTDDVKMSNPNDPNHDKIYRCPICPESFAQALELANHLSVHSHMCNVCSKTFGTKQQLEKHEQSHLSAATQYECTECDKSFLGSDSFRQHYCANKKHSEKHPPHVLSVTSSKVISNDEEEEEVDVGEDFYKCPICSKRFSSSIGLLEHQKLHEVDRPYKCLVCGKGFTQKKYLKKHQTLHEEQPYKCDRCSQSFKTESAFLSHHKTHDARRYHCSMCNKSYLSRYDLAKHEKKHLELESFSEVNGEHRCDMCYKSFNLLSELQQHQETHVGQVVYECTECDKAFAFLNLLEEHQQTHTMCHNMDSFQTQTASNIIFQDPAVE